MTGPTNGEPKSTRLSLKLLLADRFGTATKKAADAVYLGAAMGAGTFPSSLSHMMMFTPTLTLSCVYPTFYFSICDSQQWKNRGTVGEGLLRLTASSRCGAGGLGTFSGQKSMTCSVRRQSQWQEQRALRTTSGTTLRGIMIAANF